jgi:hypothetical protein
MALTTRTRGLLMHSKLMLAVSGLYVLEHRPSSLHLPALRYPQCTLFTYAISAQAETECEEMLLPLFPHHPAEECKASSAFAEAGLARLSLFCQPAF